MVESLPASLELAIFCYLTIVTVLACYVRLRVWRGKRRQHLERTRSDGVAE